MQLETFLAFVLGIVGTSGVILFLIKFTSNAALSLVLKSIDSKNAKEFERLRCDLGNKTYISKVRFDVEFQLYRELSRLFFELVKNIQIIIPNGVYHRPQDEEEKITLEKSFHEAAVQTLNDAKECLYKNAPFIPEKLYNNYMEIIQECHGQIVIHELNLNSKKSILMKESIVKTEHFVKTGEIVKAYNALNNDLRAYLSNLDVID